MSGFIAISVCLIGLTGVLFVLGIFIQMVLSFPAMLSSNAQTYVRQQPHTYPLNASHEAKPLHLPPATEADWLSDYEQDHEHNAVVQWLELVDEATNGLDSAVELPQKTQRGRFLGRRRAEPVVTRGRSLKRRRRPPMAWPVLRSKKSGRLDRHSHCDVAIVEQPDGMVRQPSLERTKCTTGWRKSMKWSR